MRGFADDPMNRVTDETPRVANAGASEREFARASPPPRAVVRGICLVAVVSFPTACGSPSDGGLELQMVEVEASPSFPMSGGALLDGSLVLWSSATGAVWIQGDSMAGLSLPDVDPIGAGIVGDSIWLADARGRSLVRRDGAVRSPTWPDGLDVEAAQQVLGSWVLVARRGSGRALYSWVPGDGVEQIRGYDVPIRVTSGGPKSTSVLVSSLDRPLFVHRLGVGSERMDSWSLDSVAMAHFPPSSRLVTMPALALDQGRILIGISDLTSDRRLHVVLHEDGTVRGAPIDVPMGFFGADSAARRLVGVLEVGDGRIVTFRW